MSAVIVICAPPVELAHFPRAPADGGLPSDAGISGSVGPPAAISADAVMHSRRRGGGEIRAREIFLCRCIGGSLTLHDLSHSRTVVCSCTCAMTRECR